MGKGPKNRTRTSPKKMIAYSGLVFLMEKQKTRSPFPPKPTNPPLFRSTCSTYVSYLHRPTAVATDVLAVRMFGPQPLATISSRASKAVVFGSTWNLLTSSYLGCPEIAKKPTEKVLGLRPFKWENQFLGPFREGKPPKSLKVNH